MKHKYIEKLIQRLLDHEISPEQERALNEHIAECQDCRELYQEMINVCIGLDTIPLFYPTPGFNNRIKKELGIRTGSIFKRIAAVSSFIWVSSLITLVIFLSRFNLFGSLLNKAPAALRLVQSINMLFNALAHFLVPVFKNAFNPSWIAFGIILCLITTILLGRIIKKEVTCSAS